MWCFFLAYAYREETELYQTVLFCCKNILFVLRFYSPVNGYGHVEPVSYQLTLFLGRLIATKRLTSTWRAGMHASGSN